MDDARKQELISHFGILKYFKYDHLPPHVQEISKGFGVSAFDMADRAIEKGNADYAEMASGLRSLMRAKDCHVRSLL